MTSRPRGPIFVVGAAGSGTTLMRLILDSHDNLAIAQETGFARLLLANEAIPFWEFGQEWYGRLGLSREDLEKELAAFYGGLFAKFAAQRGANRWGDKTPFHVWHLQLLARVFPDAQIIGMVRHPGAVAHSTNRRMRHPWQRSVRYWVRDNLELLYQGATLGDRFMLCRYEDLVTRPEPTLRQLFDWLGEPWTDQLLNYHEVHSGRGTETEVEGGTRSDKPLDPRRIGAWTDTMDDERWARLRRGRVFRLQRLLGYVPEDPVPAKPFATGAEGALLTGDGVASLVRWADKIDWAGRPRPSLPNRPLTPQELRRLTRRVGLGRTPTRLERTAEKAEDRGRQVVRRLPPAGRRLVRRVIARLYR